MIRSIPFRFDLPRVLVHAWAFLRPGEATFWARLRQSLNDRGLELIVMGFNAPAGDVKLAFPYLHLRGSVEAIGASLPDRVDWFGSSAGEDEENVREDDLLALESMWRCNPCDAAAQKALRFGVRFRRRFYRELLRTIKPAGLCVWNGYHTQEAVLRAVAAEQQIPVAFLERGPFPDTLQFDRGGILAESEIGRAREWQWGASEDSERYRRALTALGDRVRSGTSPWWHQPTSREHGLIRKRLAIPPDRLVVLFAGQLDNDVANFRFSPLFNSNVAAFRWFCEEIRARGVPVFILGKHHPLSRVSPDTYRDCLRGLCGVWTDEVALNDALALCDRVAAVNSTVLYEALLCGKPVLMLGRNLLSSKKMAYEVTELAGEQMEVDAWLAGSGFTERCARWSDFGAYVLAHHVYTTQQGDESLGLRGACELAEAISTIVPAAREGVSDASVDLNRLSVLMEYEASSLRLEKQVAEQQASLDAILSSRIWRLASGCGRLWSRITTCRGAGASGSL